MRRGATTGVLAVLAVAVWLPLATDSFAQMDACERAMAEIDRALATNPSGVPDEALSSCRAMRNTARLLHKTGRHERALRRLKACRKLLKLPGYRSSKHTESHFAWLD